MNGTAVKSKSGTSTHSSSFKLMNNIITKNDITPLAKSKSRTKVKPKNQTDDKKEIEEREPEIVDSIPSDMKPVYSFSAPPSDHSGSDDNDGLFSPMSAGQLDGDNDYSYYSDEMEHLKKFQLHTPNFVNNSNNGKNDKHHSLMHEDRLNSFDFDEQSSLPELSNDYNNTQDDFWKEVTSTNEEAISLPKEEYNTTATNDTIHNHSNDDPLSENGIVSVEDFMADDLSTNVNNNNSNNDNSTHINDKEHDAPEWNENMFHESKQRVKLLCYRDADGKLALKTRNVPLSATTASKRGMFLTAAGLARKRRNKHRKLLKKAIRRKSGVAEMLSTDVGISELML